MQEVEDLCAAAVKEEQIENKLAALAQDWALQDLRFQDYKTRGPVILKVPSPRSPACSIHVISTMQLHLRCHCSCSSQHAVAMDASVVT